jgi:ubiquinone/menaquinone biosynthesis C-methylase UbiE
VPAHHHNPYPYLAPFYDLSAKMMLLPFGGEQAFRRAAIDAMQLRPGIKVLELGCGTGSMTRLMLDAGASVTALELSPEMLERARRKAPAAQFIAGDMFAFEAPQPFDRVLISFVLHEMTADIRARALALARRCLASGGTITVLDFARPERLPFRLGLRAYLRLSEPAQALDWLRRGARTELGDAGFSGIEMKPLAMGTAAVSTGRA